VGQVLHGPAGGEQAGRGGGEPGAHLVAGPPGVAVRVRGGTGSGHERRVADHEVEAPAGHGLGEVPAQQLPVEAGEGGGGGREPQRPGGQVGGGDARGVLGQVQGLDAAAGTEVEGGTDGFPYGRVGEGGGGAADAEHVVGGERPGVDADGQVGDD